MKTSEIINFDIGIEIHFCLDAADTNAQFAMFKVVIHPNAKVPAAHYHENFDETIYGLKGSLTLTVDDHIITLDPGDYHFIKRGQMELIFPDQIHRNFVFQEICLSKVKYPLKISHHYKSQISLQYLEMDW